jgi:uroporphyrinogen decarboxylase
MNGYERIAAALRGEAGRPTPVMLHNFMMAARQAGVSMRDYRRDGATVARCFVQAVETFGYDGIVVDIDTATLAGAVGVPVRFPDDEPALCEGQRLKSLAGVRELAAPEVGTYWGIEVWLEAVRRLRRYFGDEIYVRGNCDQAPFSLAAAMRGSAEWMMDLLEPANEEDAHRLLEYTTAAVIQFVELMVEAGAHMVSNGDSPAGPSVISPGLYRRFAWGYEKRVVEAAHARGLPYLLHICGKTEPILAEMVATGADALELDQKTDARRARDILGGRTTFVGNLDPSEVLARGSVSDVEAKTRELLAIFRGNPRFILNAGCAIAATTPEENIHAMVRVARQEGESSWTRSR